MNNLSQLQEQLKGKHQGRHQRKHYEQLQGQHQERHQGQHQEHHQGQYQEQNQVYHQNDLNTIGCHLIVISLVFFKNSQFRTPRSLSPPWFPKIIYYLFIFWVTIILWLT